MPADAPAAVLAVLVVFDRSLADVKPWPTLQGWMGERRAGPGMQLERILIYDNSPLPRARPAVPVPGCDYVHNPQNGGTAAAYAAAVAAASELGIEWLLLLDHDTGLPSGFLDESPLTAHTPGTPPPAALVPWVRHEGNEIISPARVTCSGGFRPLRPGQQVMDTMQLSAIASGSVLHVATLKGLPPMPKELWLDYVDHWIFAQLHRAGHKPAISRQVLDHDLSIASFGTLSAARLRSVLDGEAIFMRLLGLFARIVYPLRLARRVVVLAWSKPALAMIAVRWIFGAGWRIGQKQAAA